MRYNPERIVYGRPGYRLSEKDDRWVMVRLSAEEFAARAEDGARFVPGLSYPCSAPRESAAPLRRLHTAWGLTLLTNAIEADNYFEACT